MIVDLDILLSSSIYDCSPLKLLKSRFLMEVLTLIAIRKKKHVLIITFISLHNYNTLK